MRPIGKVTIHAHIMPAISDWGFLLIGYGDFFFSGVVVHVLVGSNWIFLHVYGHLLGLPHYHWKLHVSVIHLPKISLGHLSGWLVFGWQAAGQYHQRWEARWLQWTNMAHAPWGFIGVPKFVSLHQLWSSSLINIINFWFWALAFIQIFSSKWHCSGMDWW